MSDIYSTRIRVDSHLSTQLCVITYKLHTVSLSLRTCVCTTLARKVQRPFQHAVQRRRPLPQPIKSVSTTYVSYPAPPTTPESVQQTALLPSAATPLPNLPPSSARQSPSPFYRIPFRTEITLNTLRVVVRTEKE